MSDFDQKNIIGIISPSNIKYVPYIQNYITILIKNKIEYRILSWDKYDIEEDVDFSFAYKVSDANRKKMIIGYIKFYAACKKYLKDNNINKLIIFTAATVFSFGYTYLKDKSFIIDIRDYSPLIRRFPKYFVRLCSLAKNVVVSSNNFDPWIGRRTFLCHNTDINLIEKYKNIPVKKNNDSTYSITFAGMMIEDQINIEIINKLANHSQLNFNFIGRTNERKEKIVEYVKSNRINNVKFQGTYNKKDIVDIYREQADIINIFRAKTMVNKNALPNKLYDSVLSGVPLAVFEHNEAITNYVRKYNLGLVFSEKDMDNLSKAILEKMQAFDFDKYSDGRQSFLIKILDDMKRYENMILEFVQ